MSMDTKTQKRKRVKKQGLEGLHKGKDYIDFGMFEGYRALAPLTYEASKLIASKYVGGIEGKWCTAWQRTDDHWISYTDEDVVLIYFVKDGDKIALAYNYPVKEEFTVYNKDDKKYDDYFEPPIDVDTFVEDNKDKLDNLNDKIINGEEKEYRQMRQKFIEAIKNNDIEKVKELMKKGVDSSIKNNFAIRWASDHGHTEIVKLLLQDDRVDPSVDNNFAIRWASDHGHTEIVKLLLQDDRVDPSVGDNWAIQHASGKGHIKIVKLLLQDERIDPSANNNFAIRYASGNGHIKIVKLLLQDERVDPSVGDNRAIRYASGNGHIKIVKLLLQDDRVDPSADDNYAIRWAFREGYIELVKLLLQDDRVRNSLTDEELQKYKEEVGL